MVCAAMVLASSIACAVFLALVLIGERRDDRRHIAMFKPLASLAFIVGGVAAGYGEGGPGGALSLWIVIGLVLWSRNHMDIASRS